MLKRTIHTYTEEDGLSFELKGEIVDGKCTGSVKGVINGVTTVDGSFEDTSENAEVNFNAFLNDAFKAHGAALLKAFPENEVAT